MWHLIGHEEVSGLQYKKGNMRLSKDLLLSYLPNGRSAIDSLSLISLGCEWTLQQHYLAQLNCHLKLCPNLILSHLEPWLHVHTIICVQPPICNLAPSSELGGRIYFHYFQS